MDRGRFLKLLMLGTVAGAFSGLFGVGGGTVIVPMLIAFLGYSERLATGTSLAAIVLIAGFAVIGFALYGRVEWTSGLLLSIPAVAGVLVGTTLQQRVSEHLISVIFALVLIGVAIQMFFF